MKTVKEIYKIGKGPSSSHTMGPFKAVRNYLENHPDSDHLHVTLYGSLAATGKGHLTDKAIEEAYSTWKWTDKETLESHARRHGEVNIEWRPKEFLQVHPNGMKIASINHDGDLYDKWTYYSIGGGDIICMDHPIENEEEAEIYDKHSMKEILDWCNRNGKTFWEYVDETEGQTYGFWEYIELVWKVMQDAVKRGIDQEGALPGPLGLRRKAASYHVRAEGYGDVLRTRGLIFSYALAVSEENACGGTIVTAPTCGSCGVIPGVLYHLKKVYGFSDQRIVRALATAGLIGNLCNGCCSCDPAYGRHPISDRICRRNGSGASSWPYLRPGMRSCTDSMHREKCLCRCTRIGCQHICSLHRRKTSSVFRPGSQGYERDWKGSSIPL